MADLLLNTPEMRAAATKFKAEASEMEGAVQSADAAFAPCRDFKSKKIARSTEHWDSLKATFKRNLEELVAAADALVKAAEGFEAADQ
jgi:uncharacterized protein YukE